VYSGKAVSLIVPSQTGYLGILAHHAPLAACLKEGRITLRNDARATSTYELKGKGVIEVLNNRATLLLDTDL
jgi:F0F1-type ATP synthase epsilon subunit